MFLSKILIHSCIITLDIIEINIFVVIVSKFLLQEKYQNVILKTALKLMLSKGL